MHAYSSYPNTSIYFHTNPSSDTHTHHTPPPHNSYSSPQVEALVHQTRMEMASANVHQVLQGLAPEDVAKVISQLQAKR